MIFVEGSVSGLGSLAWLDIATGTVTPALKEYSRRFAFPNCHPTAVALQPSSSRSIRDRS